MGADRRRKRGTRRCPAHPASARAFAARTSISGAIDYGHEVPAGPNRRWIEIKPIDRVVAKAYGEDECVVARATGHDVVAGAAVQPVNAAASTEVVGTKPTGQYVIAGTTCDDIVAVIASDGIGEPVARTVDVVADEERFVCTVSVP